MRLLGFPYPSLHPSLPTLPTLQKQPVVFLFRARKGERMESRWSKYLSNSRCWTWNLPTLYDNLKWQNCSRSPASKSAKSSVKSWWAFCKPHLKRMIVKLDHFPKLGMKRKNIWNHQLVIVGWVDKLRKWTKMAQNYEGWQSCLGVC